jgi:peptide/nickel transport system substrate-binding protein
LALGGAAVALLGAAGLPAYAQKSGGILHAVLRENPPSLSMHEESTTTTTWAVAPLYNNLVLFNPAHAAESADDLVGELADKWTWSADHKRLTFRLRRNVKWHDGKPFSAADVKYTFDLVRGVPGERRLRSNPRKIWFDNVTDIVTNGDAEVTFVLKRPQPSLLAMLAAGFSVIFPAHVDPAELRTREVGTGPFKLKAYLQEQRIELTRNPDYFIPGRPYLDGITYLIIKDRGARTAALATGQADVFVPQEATQSMSDQIKALVPGMVVQRIGQSANYNLLTNTKKPPFDTLKVRQAISYALDRQAFLKTWQGGAMPGGIMMPPPYGHWGLNAAEIAEMPGWGDPARDKAQARKLLAEAGYGPANPLKITITTRSTTNYSDMAAWVAGQLREVGVEAALDPVDTSLWYSKTTRRDFLVGANVQGSSVDDPDAVFIENFSCGTVRNYTDYCSKEADALMERTSEEMDPAKRLALAKEVDRKLQTDVARIVLGHAVDFALFWPHVKGYVPHHNAFNYGRMQDVWLDK